MPVRGGTTTSVFDVSFDTCARQSRIALTEASPELFVSTVLHRIIWGDGFDTWGITLHTAPPLGQCV
eukprot:6339570-Amphidinium_carterae.1